MLKSPVERRIAGRPCGDGPPNFAGIAAILVCASGIVHAVEPPVPAPAAGASRHPVVRDVRAEPRTPAAPNEPATAAPPPLDLGPRVIRQAIADSRDPLDDGVAPSGPAFGAGGSTEQARIDASFKRAEIPTCMTPEAYKFDPPQVGPFGLGGLLGLPFLVHAIAMGKCRH